MSAAKTPAARQRLVAVNLDEETIGRSNPDIEHERQVAIYDLLERNSFAPAGHPRFPRPAATWVSTQPPSALASSGSTRTAFSCYTPPLASSGWLCRFRRSPPSFG